MTWPPVRLTALPRRVVGGDFAGLAWGVVAAWIPPLTSGWAVLQYGARWYWPLRVTAAVVAAVATHLARRRLRDGHWLAVAAVAAIVALGVAPHFYVAAIITAGFGICAAASGVPKGGIGSAADRCMAAAPFVTTLGVILYGMRSFGFSPSRVPRRSSGCRNRHTRVAGA